MPIYGKPGPDPEQRASPLSPLSPDPVHYDTDTDSDNEEQTAAASRASPRLSPPPPAAHGYADADWYMNVDMPASPTGAGAGAWTNASPHTWHGPESSGGGQLAQLLREARAGGGQGRLRPPAPGPLLPQRGAAGMAQQSSVVRIRLRGPAPGPSLFGPESAPGSARPALRQTPLQRQQQREQVPASLAGLFSPPRSAFDGISMQRAEPVPPPPRLPPSLAALFAPLASQPGPAEPGSATRVSAAPSPMDTSHTWHGMGGGSSSSQALQRLRQQVAQTRARAGTSEMSFGGGSGTIAMPPPASSGMITPMAASGVTTPVTPRPPSAAQSTEPPYDEHSPVHTWHGIDSHVLSEMLDLTRAGGHAEDATMAPEDNEFDEPVVWGRQQLYTDTAAGMAGSWHGHTA